MKSSILFYLFFFYLSVFANDIAKKHTDYHTTTPYLNNQNTNIFIRKINQKPYKFPKKISIQYLANEGVLITYGERKIIIDGIFDERFEYLDVLPLSERIKISNASGSYNSQNLILATHFHGDHFNAQMVGNHLLKNSKAFFIGPHETLSGLKKSFKEFRNNHPRVLAITPEIFKRKNRKINDADITILRTEHFGESPWKEAENIVFLLKIGSKKIIHFGDSKIDINNLKIIDLVKEEIDIAIIPYGQMLSVDQKEIIQTYINPKEIYVGHIPLSHQEKSKGVLEELGYKNLKLLIHRKASFLVD